MLGLLGITAGKGLLGLFRLVGLAKRDLVGLSLWPLEPYFPPP
jgi:hypothetical protein